MYNGTSEGENLNYWMQNIWQQCGTTLRWPRRDHSRHRSRCGTNAGNADVYDRRLQRATLNDSQAQWYICSRTPLYPQATLSAIPTGFVENTADDGGINSGGTPMSMMISRTGYTDDHRSG
jgi:hypothetical protein